MNTQTTQNWQKTTLGDLCLKITDGSHWSPTSQDHGYPMASVKDMTEFGFNLETCRRISKQDYLSLVKSDCKPLKNDVLIAKDGSYLKYAFKIREESELVILSSIAILRPDSNKIDPYFLSKLLSSENIKKQMSNYVSGAALPRIILKEFKKFELNIPCLSTQRQIADVLSAYDDLIENNNRRNKILEDIAQKIYTEWFVNFRFPGWEKVKMVESGTEFGRIPEGWREIKLRNAISYYVGGGWGEEAQSSDFNTSGFVIRGTDIPFVAKGNISTVPFRFHKENNIRSRKVEALDIVFEVSGGSKGQPVGRHALITERLLQSFSGNAICASFCKLIRVNKADVSPFSMSLLFNQLYKDEIISKYQVQSTGISNFRFENFIDEILILIPDQEIRKNFDLLIESIFVLIQEIGIKNTNLKKARDLLIPQLITGRREIK